MLIIYLSIALLSISTIYAIKCRKYFNLQKELATLVNSAKELELQKVRLEAEIQAQGAIMESKISILEEMKERLSESFKISSFQAVEKLTEKSDKEMLKKEQNLQRMMNPVKEHLDKLQTSLTSMEKERKQESGSLKEQLGAILDSEKELRNETQNLVKAFRRPKVRGMWGEMQLRRVVEVAGMVNYCDFTEQTARETDKGRQIPDLIVNLPSKRTVIVDAKAPFEAFLDAMQSDCDNEKEQKLEQHAKNLRLHVQQLSKKGYWEAFETSPEFVILFLPAETLFSAALEVDPSLIEYATEKGVILATPTTLIGLLKAVAHGWKQDRFTSSAKEIAALGYELYKRLQDMNKHWKNVGKGLNSAVESYNKALGSYNRRVSTSAAKFSQYLGIEQDLEIEPIDALGSLEIKEPSSE